MNKIVKDDISAILKDCIALLKKGNVLELKFLSDQVIHNASIFQDEDSISIAVLIYALFKILKNNRKMNDQIIKELANAKSLLDQDYFIEYRTSINKIFDQIKEDKMAKKYIREVIEHALVKKGSRMFEHGISIAQVSNIMGISQWELMDYVGKTYISDTFGDIRDVDKRLEYARTLFK